MTRPYWFWPWRPSGRLAAAATRGVEALRPLLAGPRWLVTVLLLSTLPPLMGFAAGTPIFQPVTGFFLALLILPSVRDDRFDRALGLIGGVIGCHSALVIGLTVWQPDRAASSLSGSEAYWLRTWDWVRTGEDVEYQLSTWLPAHVSLAVGVPLTGYLSFGIVPFARGIQELDYMNYYVGRLVLVSARPEVAVACGWHPWSVVRGLSYSFLLFEAMSWSLERFLGQPLSTPKRRRTRWLIGFALAGSDALVKLTFAPEIRNQLFANLSPGVGG